MRTYICHTNDEGDLLSEESHLTKYSDDIIFDLAWIFRIYIELAICRQLKYTKV
jgi:hypothetical protein